VSAKRRLPQTLSFLSALSSAFRSRNKRAVKFVEKELLEMAEQWKKTALEELAKCEPSSRSEFANQMLLACAEMLEWKIKALRFLTPPTGCS